MESGDNKNKSNSSDSDQTQDSSSQQQVTKKIGPYSLLQKIGEGGMGEVWHAEQTHPIKRRVALKIIKKGMDSKQVIARFEAERQALAMLDHPYIAKIYDAGTTPDGRPYFAMEHVAGISITEHCDNNKLTLKQRLELFVQVAEGVQHAHHKTIVHRDLKPSNILVSIQNNKAIPKIIDFGLVKALGQSLTDATMFTQVGVVMGTPEYMSPEQASLTGQDVDTRTDIYALGVVLYNLLTGVLPFDAKELRKAGIEGIRKKICEEEPLKPSSRVSSIGDDSVELARKRSLSITELQSKLKGDLDWITMKSLEKDRSRRYSTPTEFADDIMRFLTNQPVLASPPSFKYKASKFIRRNMIPVITAVTISITMLIFIGVLVIQSRQIAEERDRVKQANVDLEMVVDFQSSMLSDIDAEAMGLALYEDLNSQIRESLESDSVSNKTIEETLSIFNITLGHTNATNVSLTLIDEQILQRAVETIEEEFADQPLIRASLKQTVAITYREIGLYDQSMPLRKEALKTRRRILGDSNPKTLVSINSVGLLLRSMGKYDEALVYSQEALEGNRRVLGDDHPNTLVSISNMGTLLNNMGMYDEALVYQQEALEGSRRVLGDDHPQTLISISNMGFLLSNMGKYDDALIYDQEALEGLRRVLGDDHSETLISINNLGALLESMDRPEEAFVYYQEALKSRRRVLGNDHPQTLTSIGNMGVLLYDMGKSDEALVYYQEALDGNRRVLGDDNPTTLISISNMGYFLNSIGKPDDALVYYQEALKGNRNVLGNENFFTLNTMKNLGGLLVEVEKFEQAKTLLMPAVANARKVFTGGHTWRLGVFLSALGRSHSALGEFNEADRYLIEANEILFETRATRKIPYKKVLNGFVKHYDAWNKAEPNQGYDKKASEWKTKLAELETENK